MIITRAFIRASQARAKSLGIPQIPVVVVAHPLASKKADQVREMARLSIPRAVEALTGQAEGLIMADGGA